MIRFPALENVKMNKVHLNKNLFRKDESDFKKFGFFIGTTDVHVIDKNFKVGQ